MTKIISLLIFLIFTINSAAVAEHIFISQTSQGTDTGGDCSNALSADWFNTTTNWSNPKQSGKIGPDDTVHLCGTITSTLETRVSGSIGHPITILWEDGAKLSQPYCNPCLNMANNGQYIVLDGGLNGIIESNNNGTNLAYQNTSQGIWAGDITGSEIKNLRIQNIYVRVKNDTDNLEHTMMNCIRITVGGSNISIHDNVLHDAGWAITNTYKDNDTNIRIYNNNIYNIDHGYALSSGGSKTAGSIYFYNNHVHDYYNWDHASNYYHHDGIHAYGVGTPYPSVSEFWIYNNIFDGDPGINLTGHIFLEGGPQSSPSTPWTGSTGTAYIFNNVFDNGGWVIVRKGSNHRIYNNTFLGDGLQVSDTTYPQIKNNFFGANSKSSFLSLYNTITWANQATDIDYNVYANCSLPYACWDAGGGQTTSDYSTWKSLCNGCDSHSKADLPGNGGVDLNSYRPMSGSLTIGSAENLISMEIDPLEYDITAFRRPLEGLWTVGAYEYQTHKKLGSPATYNRKPL